MHHQVESHAPEELVRLESDGPEDMAVVDLMVSRAGRDLLP